MTDTVEAIATCVTAIGVMIALFGLRASQRQRLREFESFYVQRYWALMDGLSLPALRAREEDRSRQMMKGLRGPTCVYAKIS
jgi:hypothetical protein